LLFILGEYDVDSTFFPGNQMLPGSEAALILYGAYMFTMFVVMANIMVSVSNIYLFVSLYDQNLICLGWSRSR
jgi:hypothetical protein